MTEKLVAVKSKATKKFSNVKKDFSKYESDPYVKKWFELGSYKETGKRSRLGDISRYCEFTGKTPTELIHEKHEDMKRDPLDKTRIAETQLKSYDTYLVKSDMFINSIVNTNGRIGGFYKNNGIPLQFLSGEMPKMIKMRSKDSVWRDDESGKVIKKDDKKLILKNIRDAFQNTRDRAFFLTRLSTGLNDGTLRSLKVGDYRNGYREEFGISYIAGIRAKDKMGAKGEFYQTFFSSEACPIINLYLKEREKTRDRPPEDSDYLFISRKRNDDGEDRQMGQASFRENLAEVCKMLGVKNITPTSFRRYFKTTLMSNGVDKELVERMMGHTGEVGAYYNTIFEDPEELIEVFAQKVDPYVCLGNGNKKYEQIATKLEKLETKNFQLTETLKLLVKGLKEQIPTLNIEAFILEDDFDEKMKEYEELGKSEEKPKGIDQMSKEEIESYLSKREE